VPAVDPGYLQSAGDGETIVKFCSSIALAGAFFVGFGGAAQAANFSGKFDIAQTDGSSSIGTIRYYNQALALSIYAAPGGNASLLQDAFFRKTFVSVGYTPIVCPGGIGGSCGTLTFISVSALNIP
jgi:hypothetical protein